MRLAGQVTRKGEKSVHNFGRKVRRKETIKRSGCKWENYTEIDFKWEGVD
jgi:hypothetical protein